jgi:hypothetical protein
LHSWKGDAQLAQQLVELSIHALLLCLTDWFIVGHASRVATFAVRGQATRPKEDRCSAAGGPRLAARGVGVVNARQ